MTARTSKTPAPKPGAEVVVPAAPTPPERPSATVETPHVVVLIDRDTLRHALERIATGRLCGCKGDHDAEQYECPKSIARTVLSEAK